MPNGCPQHPECGLASMSLAPANPSLSLPVAGKPWRLPAQGVAIFQGEGCAARLSHYFLPRVLLAGKQVLYLDGANRVDPLLIARFARQRGREPSEFNRRIKVARAFTCFQLTELLARVPRVLRAFPADILIVTAFPDLYFDEDVPDGTAYASFGQALQQLRQLGRASLPVAVFSDAATFVTPRRRWFDRVIAGADQVWKFRLQADGKPQLLCERSRLRLSARLPLSG